MSIPSKSALAISICALYEREGLCVSDIAQQLELDEMVIKSTLTLYSSKYKELNRGIGDIAELEEHDNAQKEVSKEEIGAFIEAYKELARYGESEFLREKALKNLINYGKGVTDGLGENDARKLLKDMNALGGGNILNLNMVIQNARAATKKIKSDVDEIFTIENEDSKKELSNG